MKKIIMEKAKEASKNSYSPYSKFKVGAALKTKSGEIFTASNVENSSYGLSMCAERIAVFKAVSEGFREFDEIAIYCDSEILFSPCGACRQVLAEFSPHIKIYYGNDSKTIETNLDELLPQMFNL